MLLLILVLIPLYGIIDIFFIRAKYRIDEGVLKIKALVNSMLTLIYASFVCLMVLPDAEGLIRLNSDLYSQFLHGVMQLKSIWKVFSIEDSSLNIIGYVGLDGISTFFILLTAFLIPVCLVGSWNEVMYLKQYLLIFLVIEILLFIAFLVLDLFLFYVFFESVLIPMFLLIGVYGSRSRKTKAAYYFFLYTLFGSLFMFLGIISIYLETGTTGWEMLCGYDFSSERQLILWLSFFIAFAVKIPMFPFHIWLPEAHVEAPTSGSVLLAGLMLKLGGYGFVRFLLPFFPYATEYYLPLVFTLCIIGISYASLTTLRQIDMKRIIAYSSVAHMNFVLLGVFSGTHAGIEGGIMLMIGHGLVSSALFLLVGVLYERYENRLVHHYGGLVQVMPIFTVFFFFFSISNLSFPGTSNFVGEFLILIGLVQKSTVILMLSGFGMVLSAAYSIWLFNRVAFGELNVRHLKYFGDLNYREFLILTILTLLTLFVGIYPEPLLKTLNNAVLNLTYYL